jgi:hypothetical protein
MEFNGGRTSLRWFTEVGGAVRRWTPPVLRLSNCPAGIGVRAGVGRAFFGGLGMRFFTGMHMPAHAGKVPAAFVSVNRLRARRSAFPVGDWIMDSGAFTEIATHGHYRHGVEEYAAEIRRWRDNGNLICAVAQDWMCEPWIVAKTGLSVAEHQRRTINRYDQLLACDPGVPIMPVLQGFQPHEYVNHLRAYGDRLALGAYVGVGSVCKRNGDPAAILTVLDAIMCERPDLRLHGFGLKMTALRCAPIVARLASADSMAWSYAARREGRDRNSWREAAAFAHRVSAVCATDLRPLQIEMFA